MKLKYIVTIDIDKFEFENGDEALKFAEFATMNHVPGTYRKTVDVYMNIIKVEPEEEPEVSVESLEDFDE